MTLTPSTMAPLGMKAPDFSLPDTGGGIVSLSDFEAAEGLLVIFMCNHCPYVEHLKEALADFGREYGGRGLALVGINANDPDGYPADSPERMREEKEHYGYPFPYLFDGTQEVAKGYGAACTPDFFLFGQDRTLLYRGQFNDSRPGNDRPITGRDLRAAAEALLEGRPVPSEQTASVGCNIKWRGGNEPAYFG